MSLRHLRRTVALVVIFGACLAPLHALEWARKEISTAPEPGADVVRARFEFKNPTKQVVHILEVRTSCGCTEATPSASAIAPGESGAMDVLFTIGNRTGLQEKEITLTTDDSKMPTRLALKIKLPEAAAKVAPAAKPSP